MLTAEQAELCHFLLSKTYTLMQKDTFSAREIVLESVFSCFVRDVDQDLLHLTGQDIAQIIQGSGGDIAVLFERVQRPTAERIFCNERIS